MKATYAVGLASVAAILPGTLVTATTLHVHHRIVQLPASSSNARLPPFEHRGVIDVSSSSSSSSDIKFQPDSSSVAKIDEWIAGWRGQGAFESGEVYYQVALQKKAEDNDKPHLWDVQSVKLCHLPMSTSDHFVLDLSPQSSAASDRQVEWFGYQVQPVPRDGSCSSATLPPVAKKQPPHGEVGTGVLTNSTVDVRDTLRYTPKAALRAPTPMSSTGEPISPPPEQTFLQKYWMYIVAGLLVLAVATPPPEEGGEGSGGASAGRK